MKKIYISLAALSLLFTACKKEGKSPEYTNFKILSVEVSQLPFQRPNTSSWDPFDGPDVFFNMELQDNTVLSSGSGSCINDVMPSRLPLRWNFVKAYGITNINVEQFVTVYDYDLLTTNERMGYVGFTLSDYKGSQPNTITKSNGKVTVTINGEWY